MIFDELAQQYFSSPEEFAAALKLLQRCNAAEKNYPDYADFEANFLDNLDDVTGCETLLLHKAFDYDAATKIVAGATPTLSDESESKILEAIRNQHKAHINSIPLRQAFDAFINAKKQNWKDDNNEQHYRRDIFALFHELVGDIETGDLTKDHSSLYTKAVLHLPANRNKLKLYRTHSVQELLDMEIPEQKQFSPRNKQKYLQRLSGFLQWLQDHDYAVSDIHVPLRGVINDDSVEYEERNPYTCDDLRKLFNSKELKFPSFIMPRAA